MEWGPGDNACGISLALGAGVMLCFQRNVFLNHPGLSPRPGRAPLALSWRDGPPVPALSGGLTSQGSAQRHLKLCLGCKTQAMSS